MSRIVLLSLVLCIAIPNMVMAANSITITGKIYVAEEDDDGNVIAVEIEDEHENVYPVANSGKGKELLKLIGETVNVTGTFSEEDGTITVSSYTVVEQQEEEEEEPEEDPEDM